MNGKRDGIIIEISGLEQHGDCSTPLFLSPVCAGFPSPAEDHIERNLDLNEHLIEHPIATFFLRVAGESMSDGGIRSGDIIIVDRAIKPKNNQVIVASLDGEFAVKRLRRAGGKLFLVSDNPDYQPIEITESRQFEAWGVVTWVIHQM